MATSLPAWALVPNKTFSTGQTLQDFITLARIQEELGGQLWQDMSALGLPPVLTDPNYVPKDRSKGLIAGFIVMNILTVILVSLRIYSRVRVTPKRLVLEDYTLAFGTFVVVGLGILYIYGLAKAQWGMQLYDFTVKSVVLTTKLTVLQYFLATLARYTVRISAILFIRRLYIGSGSRIIKICNYMIYFNIFCAIFSWLFELLQGSAKGVGRQLWDIEYRADYHAHFTYYGMQMVWTCSAVDLFCDTLAVLLPLRVAYSMFSAPLWKRARVFALLGIGFMTWGAAIYRFYTIAEYAKKGIWDDILNGFISNHVEIVLGTACACLPAIQALVSVAFFGKIAEADTPPRKPSDAEAFPGKLEVAGDQPQVDAIRNPAAAFEQQNKKKKGAFSMFGMREGSLFSTRHSTTTVGDMTQRRPSVATIMAAQGRRPSAPILEGIAVSEFDGESEEEKSADVKTPGGVHVFSQ